MKLKDFNKMLDDSAKFNIPNRVDEIDVRDFVKETPTIKKPIYQRLVLGAMSILLVFVFAIFGVVSNRTVTTLSIDINPSIEIDLNTFNNVVDIRGTNTDGVAFIEDLEYKGRDIDKVIDLIYDAGIENGYFTEDEAYMLIGIYSKDLESEQKVDEVINQITNITILSLVMTSYENTDLSNDQNGSIESTESIGEYAPTTTIWANDSLDTESDNPGITTTESDIDVSSPEGVTATSYEQITDLYDVSDTLAYLILDLLELDLGYTLDNLASMEIKDLIILYNQNQ